MTAGHPVKKASLVAAILFCGLLSAYLVFLCAISLWVALTHRSQPGFWVPLLTGAAVAPLALILCHRMVRRLLRLMKDDDVLRR